MGLKEFFGKEEDIANYLKGNKIAIKTHYSKANDKLLNCIHSIMGQGYTIWFDSKADKQLKIIKTANSQTNEL